MRHQSTFHPTTAFLSAPAVVEWTGPDKQSVVIPRGLGGRFGGLPNRSYRRVRSRRPIAKDARDALAYIVRIPTKCVSLRPILTYWRSSRKLASRPSRPLVWEIGRLGRGLRTRVLGSSGPSNRRNSGVRRGLLGRPREISLVTECNNHHSLHSHVRCHPLARNKSTTERGDSTLVFCLGFWSAASALLDGPL